MQARGHSHLESGLSGVIYCLPHLIDLPLQEEISGHNFNNRYVIPFTQTDTVVFLKDRSLISNFLDLLSEHVQKQLFVFTCKYFFSHV